MILVRPQGSPDVPAAPAVVARCGLHPDEARAGLACCACCGGLVPKGPGCTCQVEPVPPFFITHFLPASLPSCPACPACLQCVEDCEERFSEAQIQELLQLVRSHLPA